ncbi:MAG: hypothetical protein ACE5H1_05345, partial [Thermodesulfobacteriota bacterium]
HIKQGGCGDKFADNNQTITTQKIGRVRNPDIADQINTVLKVAKKRSSVDAALNFGFSDRFWQDLEDFSNIEKQPQPKPKAQPQPQQQKKQVTKEKSDNKQISKYVVNIDKWLKFSRDKGKEKEFWELLKPFKILTEEDIESIDKLEIADIINKKISANKEKLGITIINRQSK